MYIGHVGAALGAKRVRRSIGLVVLLVATYTPDWVDAGLCLAGLNNPVGMLSHSIPAIALFTVLGFAAYATGTRDWRAALVVAAVILSHMFLDWITGYKPTWPGGPMIGLHLYDHPIADFIAEGVVIVIGVLFYARTLPPRKRPWIDVSVMLGALLLLQLTLDIARMAFMTLPKC
jgi:membrane-bound metal-dependent hydrolase YbcI (DUF457 family)